MLIRAVFEGEKATFLQPTRHIKPLIESGFPITWTMIFLAWKASPAFATPLLSRISTDEVLNYAMNQIGFCPPEQDAWVTRLAFSDTTDIWTIQICLEELASKTPDALTYALQVWRWVLLNEIVTEWERQAEALPDPKAPRYGPWVDDFATTVFCDARDLWEELEHPLPALIHAEGWRHPCWLLDNLNTFQIVKEHRRWLLQEAETLRADIAAFGVRHR